MQHREENRKNRKQNDGEMMSSEIEKLESIPESTRETVNKLKTKCYEFIGDSPCRILFETEHERLTEAVMADAIDVIPIVGDFTNVFRAVDAMSKKSQYRLKRKAIMQAFDLLAGALPDPIGGALDLITPTNTIIYLAKRRRI